MLHTHTRFLAPAPDRPNNPPQPAPTPYDPADPDDIPDTPLTEPEPAPIQDPLPDGQPRGPYIASLPQHARFFEAHGSHR